MVIQLAGDQEFVTGDSPVIVTNTLNIRNNLFDNRNAIYIPLDPKHALFIAPGSEGGIVNKIFYVRDSFFQHVVLNNNIFENAERWILGTPTGIKKFLNDQEEYTKPAIEDNPILIQFKEKIELMSIMVRLMEKGISNDNKELIDFITNIQQHELYKNHVEFSDTIDKLRALGLNI